MRCSEEQLELVLRQRRLGEHREDAAAVVVDDHEHDARAVPRAPEQPRCVVDHREIAEQRVGRTAHLGDAERRRHQAVDAAGATIGQNSQAGARAHVHVEIADRHARSGEEHTAVRDRRGEIARDPPFERLVPRVEQLRRRRWRTLRSAVVPLVEPLRSRCGQRRASRASSAAATSAGSSLTVSVERRSGSATRLVGVDDEQPVGAADQFLDAARGRRGADLDDEIGVVALAEVRRWRRAACRRRARAAVSMERFAKPREWFGEQWPAAFSAQLDESRRAEPGDVPQPPRPDGRCSPRAETRACGPPDDAWSSTSS